VAITWCSAHITQEVEVFYQRHALYGQHVKRQYSAQRSTGEVRHVEVPPAVVIVVPAWLLDAASCTGIVLSEPRASVDALTRSCTGCCLGVCTHVQRRSGQPHGVDAKANSNSRSQAVHFAAVP